MAENTERPIRLTTLLVPVLVGLAGGHVFYQLVFGQQRWDTAVLLCFHQFVALTTLWALTKLGVIAIDVRIRW